MKKMFNYISAFILIALLSGCADYVTFQQAILMENVGFWYGLWHGMIAPFAWFCSLFSDSVSIYAIYNNGGWYDFGYILGICSFSSSLSYL